MSVTVVPHLNFRGNAREALDRYHAVFGGERRIATYADFGGEDPDDAGNVIWGQVVAENGFRIMAYDVQSKRPFDRGDRSFYVSLRGDSEAEVERYWAGLAEGGTIVQPLGPAAWSPLYGMVTDRFGITWIVDVLRASAG